ncbi:transketolase [Actinoplanes sp. N902-109]|uniref:transketolase n=1 Tax=Actinoplanes sp. (strain N902-109) TaxID=649831 RepID=UPI00032943FE|nr:transketolase [Actinoplanes sp. N902-109]AGL15003.1 transketolase subunit A [Actinoplanes sp. N902-109]
MSIRAVPVAETIPAGTAAFAARARERVLRLAATKALHVGPALSVLDVLAALQNEVLRSRPGHPEWAGRDRLVLSKGHGAYGLYAVLAEAGVLTADLAGLPGHPGEGVPGVEAPTGALGHGLSLGCGMALGLRLRGLDSRVAVVTGDGELDEGTNWEAAQFAAHHRLSNLLVVVDRNGLQQEGRTEQVLGLEPLADKWRAFGWRVAETDGHDHAAVRDACLGLYEQPGPGVLIAKTVKGKGVSFMEDHVGWHMGQLTGKQLLAALDEVTGR